MAGTGVPAVLACRWRPARARAARRASHAAVPACDHPHSDLAVAALSFRCRCADRRGGDRLAANEVPAMRGERVTVRLVVAGIVAAALLASASARAALAVSMVADRPAAVIGEQLTITVTVTNTGPGSEADLLLDIFQMFDDLGTSPFATLVSSNPAGCQFVNLGTFAIVECPVGTLAANQSRQFAITAALTPESRFRLGALADVVDATTFDSRLPGSPAFTQVNVSADTLVDTDEDGVGDFNEELAGTSPDNPLDTPGAVTIDVLALYSPGAVTVTPGGAVETRVNHLVAVMNTAFADSGVAATFRVAATQPVDASDTMTNGEVLDAMGGRDGPFADLDTRREAVSADVVLLFRPQVETAVCGLAFVLGGGGASEDEGSRGDISFPAVPEFDIAGDADFALGTVNIDCRDRTTAHEVGHIMGLGHDRRDPTSFGTFPFSRGYGVDDEFVDIMGRAPSYGSAEEVDRFSSPDFTCQRPGGAALPCGIAAGSPMSAHAARSLDVTRFQVAAYFGGLPSAANLDLDGNGTVTALTDGMLLVRALFGLTGATLTDDALGAGATRSTAADIEAFVGGAGAAFDVDGNGTSTALTDGVLVMRFLFGFSGDALVAGAIGEGATRSSAQAITGHLDPLVF
jgi:hypothetical protein